MAKNSLKKIVKRYGSSFIVVIDKEDQDIYDIEEGDIIEMSDMIVIKKKNKRK